MTPEQRAALDALPAKRRVFVLAYVGEAAGNATAAARIAKYAKPTNQGSRLLTFADVRAAIEAFREPAERAAIASVEELRELWSSIARGEVYDASANPIGNRLKAAELLGKSTRAFVERRELSGPNGGAIPVASVPASREEAEARLAELQTKLRRRP